jgi:Xaa-Pro aminopeptidase
MKSDIDRLMGDSGLDALLVAGPAGHNAAMTYFTGLVHVTRGYLIKKRDEEPVLLHAAMERDEAARTGLRLSSLNDYDQLAMLVEAGGDYNLAGSMLLRRILEDHEVRGRVGLYGKVEIGSQYGVLQLTDEAMPDVEFVGESGQTSTLARARTTKGEEEVERIRAVGRITTAVVGDVAEFLTSHDVRDGVLITQDGEPLTVGEVKRRINLWLAIRGAENREDTIFAIGADAGVPHSAGTSEDRIELGKTIIFDIFPAEFGGGYCYDMTRTWCLDHATDEVLQIYDDVLEVYEKASAAMKANELCRDYQILTCELFEEKGHPTIMSNPKTQEGYVHGLGHGVGLNIHEVPFFNHVETNQDMLVPGSVFTIEPGLYYQERGYGVRIENTTWMRPDGKLEVLADFPKDLVLKMKRK